MLSFDLVIDDEDVRYESKILECPDSLTPWMEYYRYKEQLYQHVEDKQLNIQQLLFILKRACGHFVKSYKFWEIYLDLRISLVKELNPIAQKKHFLNVNQLFEQCLQYMTKFPMIWVKYLRFLIKYQYYNLSLIRRVFNKALVLLPLTQHELLWSVYLSDLIDQVLLKNFATSNAQELLPVVSNAYLRYLKFNSTGRTENGHSIETFIDKLETLHAYKTIVTIYDSYIINKSNQKKLGNFVSSMGKSIFDVYLEYCDYVTQYAEQLEGSLKKSNDKIDNFIKTLYENFPDQMGLILVKYANYYVQTRNFSKATTIFESNLSKCLTIKDFNLIYDAYLEFQESYISSLMDEQAKEVDGELSNDKKNDILDIQLNKMEDLLSNRIILVLDILIRQDSNNCCTWLKKIHEINDLQSKLKCFATAAQTIDPSKAHFYDYETNSTSPENNSTEDTEKLGTNNTLEIDVSSQIAKKMQDDINRTTGLSQIWIEYAQIYADNNDIDTACRIYETAVKVPFMNTNDLVNVYILWAELMIYEEKEEVAIKILQDGLVKPNFKLLCINEDDIYVLDTKHYKAQLKTYKSLKLWSFYLDLIESTDDIDRTIKAYDTFLNTSGAVTPLIVVNYCNFLQANQYFSKVFQVFENAISKFRSWEVKIELYIIYLKLLIKRYNDTFEEDESASFALKERIRDTFEVALDGCPILLIDKLYLMYIKFEELGIGETKNSMKIFMLHKAEILHLHFDKSLLESGEKFFKLLKMKLNSTESIANLGIRKQQKQEVKKKNLELLIGAYQSYIKDVKKFTIGDSDSLKEYAAEQLRNIYENIVNYEPGMPKIEKLKFSIQWIFEVELKLKQIDRCRQIFVFCSQKLIVKSANEFDILQEFWNRWELFELDYGNEDTFKEMLKIKRGDQF